MDVMTLGLLLILVILVVSASWLLFRRRRSLPQQPALAVNGQLQTSGNDSVAKLHSVFISYARQDQRIARALAEVLLARGYNVWWDVNLVGSDEFREVIQANLRSAGAVIVIWSAQSAASRFVRQEADEALHYGKLISSRVRGMEIMDIPIGFREQHTDFVDDRERILAALQKLMSRPQILPSAFHRTEALTAATTVWRPIAKSELDAVITSRAYLAADVVEFYDAYLPLLFFFNEHKPLDEENDWKAYIATLTAQTGRSVEQYRELAKTFSSNSEARRAIERRIAEWQPLVLKEIQRISEMSCFNYFGWIVILQLCSCLDSRLDELTLRAFGTLLIRGKFSLSSVARLTDDSHGPANQSDCGHETR